MNKTVEYTLTTVLLFLSVMATWSVLNYLTGISLHADEELNTQNRFQESDLDEHVENSFKMKFLNKEIDNHDVVDAYESHRDKSGVSETEMFIGRREARKPSAVAHAGFLAEIFLARWVKVFPATVIEDRLFHVCLNYPLKKGEPGIMVDQVMIDCEGDGDLCELVMPNTHSKRLVLEKLEPDFCSVVSMNDL